MKLNPREKWLAIVAAAALVIIGMDRLVVGPVLDAYRDMDDRQSAALANLQQARRLTQQRRDSVQQWEQMQASGLLTDPSGAENQLLHAVRGWSRQAGLNLVSLQPERASPAGELREITFAANGNGTIQAVVRFLELIQQSQQPMRVRRLRITGVDGREDLAIEMRLSTIYHHIQGDPPPLLPVPSPELSASSAGTTAMGSWHPAHAAAMRLVFSTLTAAGTPQDDPAGDAAAPAEPTTAPRLRTSRQGRIDPHYQIIVDRNIFSKTRTPPTPDIAASTQTPGTLDNATAAAAQPPADPGAYFVLRGISQVDDQVWAFFEDLRDGSYHRLLPGQTLSGRLIQAITFNQITVEHNQQSADILVGTTLTGRPPTAAALSDSPSATAGDTDEAALSIIERLRRRRQQEATP